MRVLEVIFRGRLYVNVFHNRIQYIVVDKTRKRYCSFVYRPALHTVDRTESEDRLPEDVVMSAIHRAMQSKRAKALHVFPEEVVRYFTGLRRS